MKISSVLRATVFLLLIAAPAWAVRDCGNTRTNIDRLMCSNDQLWAVDQRMALAFREAFVRVEDKQKLLDEQRDWLKLRDACNEVPCLLKAYRERISELDTY